MKAYFLSDLHLKSMQERNSQTLLRFLLSVHEEQLALNRKQSTITSNSNLLSVAPPFQFTYMFLVGDIFDLWIGKHKYFVHKFQPLVDALRECEAAGVVVHYFEGNHDLYLKQFWKELGIFTHEDALVIEIDNVKVRIEHGDLMNPEDSGYLFLRWFLRTPVMKILARILPGFIVTWIGKRASHASRDYTSTQKALPEDQIRQIIRTHAIKEARKEQFDLLISGHVHVRDDYSFPVMRISDVESEGGASEGTVRSINLGSWFDEPKVFVLEDGVGRFESL